jgi:hypothetical protein
MREKLNENPAAQAGIVLVLLIAVGFFLLKGMGGGEESEGGVAETTAPVTAEAVETPVEGVASTSASALLSSVPAPPLPKDVTAAYESGKTVVLLIVHDGGIDDELARKSVAGLEAMADTAVFVVPAHQIYRYAAITLGVDVDRVPALVVLRPKDLAKGGPEASIGYGFQTPESVGQAVRDARYDGPTVTYHPE